MIPIDCKITNIIYLFYLIALWYNLHQRSVGNRHQQPFCTIHYLLINKIIFTYSIVFSCSLWEGVTSDIQNKDTDNAVNSHYHHQILNEMIPEKIFKFRFEQMKWQIQIEYWHGIPKCISLHVLVYFFITASKEKLFRISRNIGGDLNLAIWRMLDKSPNLKTANLIFVHLSWHSKHQHGDVEVCKVRRLG